MVHLQFYFGLLYLALLFGGGVFLCEIAGLFAAMRRAATRYGSQYTYSCSSSSGYRRPPSPLAAISRPMHPHPSTKLKLSCYAKFVQCYPPPPISAQVRIFRNQISDPRGFTKTATKLATQCYCHSFHHFLFFSPVISSHCSTFL